MLLDLKPQNVSTEEFIRAIKSSGPYCIRTLPDIKEIEYTAQNYAKNWTFPTDAHLQRAIRGGLPWANSYRNGVFLVVNNGGHCDDSIDQVTAQFIDFDHVSWETQLELLNSFRIPPSIVTLPNRGLHAYWLIKDGDVSKFRSLQKRLIHYFGSDPTVVNESRLMRLPGFFHQKMTPKMVEVLYWHPEHIYTQDELNDRLDELGVPDIIAEKKPSNHVDIQRSQDQAPPIEIVDQTLLSMIELHVGTLGYTDGEQFKCLCPMHNDHHPSGVYFAGNEWFYCHACQRSWALTELATVNGWSDITDYLKQRRLERFGRVKTKYLSDLQTALQTLPTLSRYVYMQSKVTALDEQRITKDVVDTFVSTMEQRGIRLSDHQYEVAKQIVQMWEQPQNTNQPIVWSALPGSGKSTLRNLHVDIKSLTDPTFGCILVVERKEDADRIATELNRFEQIAWSYLGWDMSWCLAQKTEYERGMCQHCTFAQCRVLQNQEAQQRHRVVITTHQRFVDLATKGKLGSTLGHWVDDDGERQPRKLLIIDEAPPMLERMTITQDDLHRLNESVEHALVTAPSFQDEWSAVYHDVTELMGAITHPRRLSEDAIQISVSGYLTQFLNHLPLGDTWEGLQHFLHEGGLVHVDAHKSWTITVSTRVKYKWDGLCPFILDGTGASDTRYSSDYQCISRAPTSAPPVKLHVCTDFGFGKHYMMQHTDNAVFDCQTAVVRSLTLKHEKLLVVVRKEWESEYANRLEAEMGTGKVLINHFGNMKGRNDFQKCDAVLFLGVLDKGDEYYLASALTLGNPQPNVCLDTAEFQNVHRFVSTEVEKWKLNEMAIEFAQDVYRTRVRQGKPVDVYVFSRDTVLMTHSATLLGLTAIDLSWKPVEVIPLTKASRRVTALIQALVRFVDSGEDTITKASLREDIGLTNETDKVWRRLFNNEYVQAFCLQQGITAPKSNSRILQRTTPSDNAEVWQTA